MIYINFNGFANKLIKHCCATPMIKSNILNECIYIILIVFSLNVIAKIFLKISFGSFNDSNLTCVFFFSYRNIKTYTIDTEAFPMRKETRCRFLI